MQPDPVPAGAGGADAPAASGTDAGAEEADGPYGVAGGGPAENGPAGRRDGGVPPAGHHGGGAVRRAAEPLEVPMEVRSIRFTAQAGEERLTCDVPWSTEALGNILKNCMEHAASRVQVTARRQPFSQRSRCRMSGPGFDPEELPRLFRGFTGAKTPGRTTSASA